MSIETVTVSDSAARRIAEIVATEADKKMLRVTVSGGGCSGFQYGFELDNAAGEDDLVIEKDGATVLIDSMSLMYMEGSEIDFRRRSDRRRLPDKEPERDGVVRLRHQLLDLTPQWRSHSILSSTG